MPAVDKSGGSKSVGVQRVWEVYDERLQYMSRQDAFRLDDSLDSGEEPTLPNVFIAFLRSSIGRCRNRKCLGMYGFGFSTCLRITRTVLTACG